MEPLRNGTAGGGVRLGLALGGGSELGLAHLGVLRVLEHNGFIPSAIAGCSAGSLVGAFYAAGASIAKMRRLGMRLNWRAIQRVTIPFLALSTNEPLRAFLIALLPVRSFDALRIPLRLVTTDLCTGQMVVFQGGPGLKCCGIIKDPDVIFTTGDLVEAVRASCARPIINKPVELDGRILVDGCLANNVPASLVRDMGVDVVVGVDLKGRLVRDARPKNILSYATQAHAIYLHWGLKNRHIAADVVISPDFRSLDDRGFSSREEIVRCGEIAAEAALPLIRNAVASHIAGARRRAVSPPQELRENPAPLGGAHRSHGQDG